MSAALFGDDGLDALSLAEHIIREYAADLVGGGGEALQEVAQRLDLSGNISADGRTQELARMRGPYLQALTAPAWSPDRWRTFAEGLRCGFAPEGLRPELVDLIEAQGINRLYAFQQDGMRALLDDQDTLITAATGRGKTETWLLPILQYVLQAKDGRLAGTTGDVDHGTKALLLYPTKALAQDQLRRLIRYLVPINRQRAEGRRVTVGIFDGDTPWGNQPDDRDYLNKAFRLFDCPVTPEERCAVCPRRLTVEPRDRGRERLTVVLPQDECERRVPLDFVVLTRPDMLREQPDILITNPDMLHQRLLNVNDSGWRQLLVAQPRFLVIDEIHTYTGAFGAMVAWIIRRLRAVRAAIAGQRPLRIVAASATVANGLELFARVAGVDPEAVTAVREQPAVGLGTGEIEPPSALELPAALTEERWSPDSPATWIADPHVAAALGGAFETADVERVGETLYRRLTPVSQQGAAAQPALRFAAWVYRELHERPATPAELRARLAEHYGALGMGEREAALANALTILTTAGLLEARAHLFAWPVDGYYACVSCGRMYLEPRATCACGNAFITRVVACSVGGELSAEGWWCPECLTVYPLSATEEGTFVLFDAPTCAAGHAEETCLRVVWRAYGTCSACGAVGVQREQCRVCGTPIPVGGASRPPVRRCQACGAMDGDGVRACTVCGGETKAALELPWACTKCGHLAYPSGVGESQPGVCGKCGHAALLIGALLEARLYDRCQTCRADVLAGRSCAEPGHETVSGGVLDQFSLIDSRGKLHRPRDHRQVVPCYHAGATYELHRRYQALARSPANVAVTSAQSVLRRIAGAPTGGAVRAKMLSFSDSHGDMEELARDFNDPEEETFVDQVIFGELDSGAKTLLQLVEAVEARLPDQLRSWRSWRRSEIETRVVARFVRGPYSGRYRAGTLPAQGLADFSFDPAPAGDVVDVLARLLSSNGQRESRLRTDLRWNAEQFARALAAAEGRWTATYQGFVKFALAGLRACKVGQDTPIARRPNGVFVSSARRQVASETNWPEWRLPLEERTDPNRPHFSRTARRILSTSAPLMLRGETYKGSTPREIRRQIEYAFGKRDSPNFLSSGPAMEVGIDIGDLDRVLLYGTPPNINAYLQRIGRAGRRTKQSLVMSVSKRNPIDLFYYRDPLRLITSTPQPVPLQEHNERVVERALTAAVLDWVATHFEVPWEVVGAGDEARLVSAGAARRRTTPTDMSARAITWTRLLREPTERVDPAALTPLDDLVRDHAAEIRVWLRSLLDYGLCAQCGQTVPKGRLVCARPGCGGNSSPAQDRFGGMIDEVVTRFPERMLWAPFAVLTAYEDIESELMDRSIAIRRAMTGLPLPQRAQRQGELRQIDRPLQLVMQLKSAAAQASLVENHERSEHARFGYDIRGIDDQVAVELVSTEGVGAGEAPKVERTSRAMGPALREYAPGAVSLHNTDEYVTLGIQPNPSRTDELGRRLNELAVPTPRACPACQALIERPDGTSCPACAGGTVPVHRMVPGTARAFLRDAPLRDHPADTTRRLFPSHAFPLGDGETRLRDTFIEARTQVLRFDARRGADIVDGEGTVLGRLEVGELELLFTSNAVAAAWYVGGEREARPRLFEVCGEEGCGGLIAPRVDGVAGFCMLEPEHSTSSARIVQLANGFKTVGVRLTGMEVEPLGHSLAHGLRAGLEKVAGVLVRGIGELVEDDAVYLYDGEAGGAGVTELLLDPASDYQHFRTALEVAQGLVDCQCEDGCPQCLFQYGCDRRNQPRSLSRIALAEVVRPNAESPMSMRVIHPAEDPV